MKNLRGKFLSISRRLTIIASGWFQFFDLVLVLNNFYESCGSLADIAHVGWRFIKVNSNFYFLDGSDDPRKFEYQFNGCYLHDQDCDAGLTNNGKY